MIHLLRSSTTVYFVKMNPCSKLCSHCCWFGPAEHLNNRGRGMQKMWNNSISLASHSSDSCNTNLLGCSHIAANFFQSMLSVMQSLWKPKTIYAARVDQKTRLTNTQPTKSQEKKSHKYSSQTLFLWGILSGKCCND